MADQLDDESVDEEEEDEGEVVNEETLPLLAGMSTDTDCYLP